MDLLSYATLGFSEIPVISGTLAGVSLIRAMLESRLNTLSPALATAWENAPYTPVAGTPYQRAWLLIATPDNSTMGDGYFREQGIFQITLMYPLQTGTSTAAIRAEAIRTAFKRGTSMTGNGITVRVELTPEIAVGRVDEDRWALPVKIRWSAGIIA
jgi:hypothetical protein